MTAPGATATQRAVQFLEGGVSVELHSSTGSIMDSYRLQAGMDKHEHTSMRRSQSHAAHRAIQNPLSNSTSPEPLPTILPSLEPVGCVHLMPLMESFWKWATTQW
eukprot:7151499-Karenia_brevis.AAC.1